MSEVPVFGYVLEMSGSRSGRPSRANWLSLYASRRVPQAANLCGAVRSVKQLRYILPSRFETLQSFFLRPWIHRICKFNPSDPLGTCFNKFCVTWKSTKRSLVRCPSPARERHTRVSSQRCANMVNSSPEYAMCVAQREAPTSRAREKLKKRQNEARDVASLVTQARPATTNI